MAYLQTKDFTKNASAGDYAGKDRHSIVEFKIKDKKPFIISATATGPKVYAVSYDKKSKILVYRESLSSKKLERLDCFIRCKFYLEHECFNLSEN